MSSTNLLTVLTIPAALLMQACTGSVGSLSHEAPGSAEERAEMPAETPSEGDSEEANEAEPTSEPAAPDEGKTALGAMGSCGDFSDDAILAAVYDGPKVPAGYEAEPAEENGWALWGADCADSMASTKEAAVVEAESSNGKLTGAERITPRFHEVDIALCGGLYTMHYRETRCDYFDGKSLVGKASAEALRGLAVYLWYTNWSATGGVVALGGIGREEGGARTFTLCEARTKYGDCGLCDEVVLMQSTYSLAEDGTVTLPGEAEMVRSIKGRCDP